MNIRQQTEQIEHMTLSPEASFADETKGRLVPTALCDIRTEYQKDRDKILHSKSFRRLKHKTQVFIIPEGDHYRTRLTHTLEVAQIARTIGRALRLNEDLIEAIALGHDLGHTPFGHAGERVLNDICPYGFEHNKHSIRIVDVLENGTGLNLTYEVRDGILNHRSASKPSTPEGMVVRYADKIAYINHDIDDAIRGGIIKGSDIPKECSDVLGNSHSERINTMVKDLVAGNLSYTPDVDTAAKKLREFMFERVYYVGSNAKTEEHKAEAIIAQLYEFFIKNPDKMPENEKKLLAKSDDLEQTVCDYIAGMSDGYAVRTYSDFFLPYSWKIK